LGSTTTGKGSVSKTSCTVSCSLGKELLGEKCEPCIEGYYRNDMKQEECVACPYGETTYAVGSQDNKCLKKCSLGFEVDTETNECMACNSGYYRENTMTSSGCMKCPVNKTTKAYGSTKQSQCTVSLDDKYDITLRFTSLVWNISLADSSTPTFRKLAVQITQQIMKLYESEETLSSIAIQRFESGSVIAHMTLTFNKTADPLKELRDSVSTGTVNGIDVDSSSLKADQCPYIECPVDKICWSNSTAAGCKCQDGFYSTSGGKCLASCSADYCKNGGSCEQTDTGRSCRCESDYSGETCEIVESSHIGLILGIIFAVLIILLVAFYCRRRYRSGEAQLYKKRKLFNEEYANQQKLDSLSNTPAGTPAVLIKKDHGIENKAVEEDEETTHETKINVSLKQV